MTRRDICYVNTFTALENMRMINKAYDMMRKVKDMVGDEVADDDYMKV